MHLVRAALVFVTGFAGAALAQTTPSPDALHTCTENTNPRALQECLERNSGVDSRFVPVTPERPTPGKLLEDRGAFHEETGPPP